MSKTIALSFDDGPAADTAAIVTCLERHGASATFFVIGSRVAGSEAELRRMHESGFEIGNHTHGHVRLAGLSEPEILDELERASTAIEAAVGARPSLVRPPYGDGGDLLPAAAGKLGLLPVHWTLSTHDYDGKDAAAIAALVLGGIARGGIVLLHDGGPEGERRPATVEAVERLVPELQRRGYTLGTVSEVLDRYPATRRYVVPGTAGFGRRTRSPLRRLRRLAGR